MGELEALADVVEENDVEGAVAEEEGIPSLAEIIENGAPPEYIPLLVINLILVLFIIGKLIDPLSIKMCRSKPPCPKMA